MKVTSVGSVLRAVRERAKLSQEELARRMHRSPSCISKYENDRKVIDLPTLMQWAEETNAREVVVAFLYGMDGISMLARLLGIG